VSQIEICATGVAQTFLSAGSGDFQVARYMALRVNSKTVSRCAHVSGRLSTILDKSATEIKNSLPTFAQQL
jgi:hypothetical protein